MGSRQIKGDNASVRCEGNRVIFKGTTVLEGSDGSQSTSPAITVGTTEPATPAVNDLWIDTDN